MCFFVRYLSRKFYGRVIPVCFLDELGNFFSGCVPQGEHVIYIPFPLEGFNFALIDNFCFYCRLKDVGERDRNFGPHRSAMSL